jgi:hypothetical protein
MRRALRSSFVVTVGAATLACTPARTRKLTSEDNQRPAQTSLDFEHAKRANPSDPKGRTILVAQDGQHCYVDESSAYGTKVTDVDCPPAMDDPAWDHCRGGQLYVPDDRARPCACYFGGNPPMAPFVAPCPK